MEIDIRIPDLRGSGPAKLVKWLVKADDHVEVGDLVAEIATSTATMEIEAGSSGQIVHILVEAGRDGLMAGSLLAIIDASRQRAADIVAPVVFARVAPAASRVQSTAAAVRTVSMSVRDALREAMAEEMRRDANVFVIGEEVAEYDGPHKVTQGLLQEFGEARVVDTPITEHGFTGLAVGTAYAGMRPIAEFMTFNFALQAVDQIMNSAAKARYISGGQITCPIVFRGPNGAAPRVGAQHAQDFSAMFANVPGLKVIAPWSAADAKGLLKSAIRDDNPVVFLENEILYGETSQVPVMEDFLVPIGKANVVRAGKDVTLVSFSICMGLAMQAANELDEQGIAAEVIDLRTLRPLDTQTVIDSVCKTGRCVCIEEGWPQGGIGAEIAACLVEHAFTHLKAPVLRVTGADVPMPYAANLERLALPSVETVVQTVMKVLRHSA